MERVQERDVFPERALTASSHTARAAAMSPPMVASQSARYDCAAVRNGRDIL